MYVNQKFRRLVDLPEPSGYAIGQVLKATVSHVNSTRNFALQPTDNEATLDAITDMCADLAEDRPETSSILVGTLWCAVFREDGLWYRSLIQSIDEAKKLARVYFIDYGNSDTISMVSDLRWLSDELMNFPPQLIECQWHQPDPTPNSITKLEDLIDRVEPVTVTVIETKYTAKEMNLHIGSGQAGMIVVSIKELDGDKAYVKPALESVPESVSDMDSSMEGMESDSSGTVGASSDSVDGDGPKMTQTDTAEAGRTVVPAAVYVDQAVVIQPTVETKTVVQPSANVPKVAEPDTKEAIPTFRPAPYVEKQVLAPTQPPPPVEIQPKTSVETQALAQQPPVVEPELAADIPVLIEETKPKLGVRTPVSGLLSKRSRDGSVPSFQEAILQTVGAPELEDQDTMRFKLAGIDARMQLLDITCQQTTAENVKYRKLTEDLYTTVAAIENETLDLKLQRGADKEGMKTALEKITAELCQLKELFNSLGESTRKEVVEPKTTQPKFNVPEEEIQFLRIEIEAEKRKTDYLTSCLAEKDRLLAQKLEEHQKVIRIVEFKEEELRTLRSRLPQHST